MFIITHSIMLIYSFSHLYFCLCAVYLCGRHIRLRGDPHSPFIALQLPFKNTCIFLWATEMINYWLNYILKGDSQNESQFSPGLNLSCAFETDLKLFIC